MMAMRTGVNYYLCYEPRLTPFILHLMRMIHFIVTGFGPFGQVVDNPTRRLVELINDQKSSLPINIVQTAILKVSIQDVDREHAQITSMCNNIAKTARESPSNPSPTKTRAIVLVHLGVAERAEEIRLETCAYNECSFRIPDQDGQQPVSQSIDRLKSVGDVKKCCLPLEKIVERMRQSDLPVVLSDDAGRYLCNYIYYKSLKLCDSHKCEGATIYSLFVHVPPFESGIFKEDLQFEFLINLLERIQEELSE